MSALESLLSTLDSAIEKADSERGIDDAIDAELRGPARTSGVVSLRDSPAVEAFREELVSGMIRVDTVNRLLRLVDLVVTRMMSG